MENEQNIPQLDRRALLPFIIAATFWFILSMALCCYLGITVQDRLRAVRWFFILFTISLLDLLALAKVVLNLLELQVGGNPEKRIFVAIRTSYWGAIKIVCILIFGTILVKGGRLPTGIPTAGLLTGVSTLVMVPLFGGALWHLLGSWTNSEEDGFKSGHDNFST